MIHISKRICENMAVWLPEAIDCAGVHGIPAILAEHPESIPENWIGFNYCKSARSLSRVAIHTSSDINERGKE